MSSDSTRVYGRRFSHTVQVVVTTDSVGRSTPWPASAPTTGVPDAQGLACQNTLKAQRVYARLLWFPDENHWVLKLRNSKLRQGEYFGWLKRYDVGR